MASEITTHATEEGTIVLTIAFTDDTSTAVAPDTLTWSLTDRAGTAINERTDVEVESPSSTETLVLSGDDLAISENVDVVRVLTLKWTYDSDAGNDLPANDEFYLHIDELLSVS